MANTTRLGIALLEASQAQKEVTINEALTCIDAVVLATVKDKDLTAPPASPSVGDVYLLPASGTTGAWSGRGKSLAYFDQIWRFIAPVQGMRVWVRDEVTYYLYNGTAWEISTTGEGGSSSTSQWVADGTDIAPLSSPVLTAGQTLKGYTTGGTQKISLAQLATGNYLQLGQTSSNLSGIKFNAGSAGLALQMEGSSAESWFPNRLGIGSGASGGTAKLTVYGASGEGTNGQTVRIGQSASIDFAIRRNTSSGTLEFEGTQTGSRGFKFMSGAVAVGASDADASALLDIQSTSKGVLLPRMTTAQKAAITTPAQGLGVYDTTLGSISFYNGTAWVEPGGVDNTAWSSYTPTVSAQSGTFTSVSATGAYKQLGKTVFVRITVTVTTLGSAAGTLFVTLPSSAVSAGYMLLGRENGATGKLLQGYTTSASSTLNIVAYDNISTIVSGANIFINGMYQTS